MPDIGMTEPPVLQVEDLTVRFRRRDTDVAAVNGVDFSLRAGETLTILGESGSGKSVSLKALMGLLPDYAEYHGKVWLNGQEILGLPAAALAKLRGGALSMIFQEPMAALDPVYTIGEQIAETIIQHDGCDHRTAMKRALGLAGAGEDPVRRAAAEELSARDVGRNAAAGDDRSGAGMLTQRCCWRMSRRRRWM